jgi:hypothetical protein
MACVALTVDDGELKEVLAVKPSRILAPGLACLLFLTLLSVAWAEAVGVSWRNFGTRDTASIDWYTPNSITYWGGYKIGSQ